MARGKKEIKKHDWEHWKPTEEEKEELLRYYKTDFSNLSFETIKPALILIAIVFTVIMVFRNIKNIDSSITNSVRNIMESVANEGLKEEMDEEDFNEIQNLVR